MAYIVKEGETLSGGKVKKVNFIHDTINYPVMIIVWNHITGGPMNVNCSTPSMIHVTNSTLNGIKCSDATQCILEIDKISFEYMQERQGITGFRFIRVFELVTMEKHFVRIDNIPKFLASLGNLMQIDEKEVQRASQDTMCKEAPSPWIPLLSLQELHTFQAVDVDLFNSYYKAIGKNFITFEAVCHQQNLPPPYEPPPYE